MSANSEPMPPESLSPPQPVQPVDAAQAAGMVRLEPETLAKLDMKVDDFIAAVIGHPLQSEEFKARLAGAHTLGNEEIRAAAGISNRLLEKPMRAMSAGVFDSGSDISRALLDLRAKVEELDPSRQGNLLEPRKLLGLIPMGSRIHDYFRQYESAQAHINGIIQALYAGQDELRKDNAAIEEEKIQAWKIMEKLEQYAYLGNRIDAALERKLAEIEAQDPEKARVVREELQFYVRQKVQDILTQLAVTIQGYLAMDMIRKNNLELIKGVERATTTTISALRTAVIVAQALANQKLVLDQVGALRATTGGLIESTSAMLKQQAGRVQEQAGGTAVDLKQLQAAFQNIYETVDRVAAYKLQALDHMRQTVDALTQAVAKSKTYLDRTREETVAEAAGALSAAKQDEIVL